MNSLTILALISTYLGLAGCGIALFTTDMFDVGAIGNVTVLERRNESVTGTVGLFSACVTLRTYPGVHDAAASMATQKPGHNVRIQSTDCDWFQTTNRLKAANQTANAALEKRVLPARTLLFAAAVFAACSTFLITVAVASKGRAVAGDGGSDSMTRRIHITNVLQALLVLMSFLLLLLFEKSLGHGEGEELAISEYAIRPGSFRFSHGLIPLIVGGSAPCLASLLLWAQPRCVATKRHAAAGEINELLIVTAQEAHGSEHDADLGSRNPARDPRLWRVAPALLLPLLGRAMIGANLPNMLIKYFNAIEHCDSRFPDHSSEAHFDCGNNPATSAKATFDIVGNLLAIITAPLQGQLSDVYGRRPVLIVSTVLAITPMLALLFTNDVWFYFGATTLAATCGSTSGLTPTIYACAADLAHPDKRSVAIGILFGLTMIGVALGPLLSIYAASNQHMNFVIAAAISALVVPYMIFFFPETLPLNRRRQSISVAAAFNPMKAALVMCKKPIIRCLALICLFASLAENGVLESVLVYLRDVVNFTEFDNAWLFVLVGIVSMYTQIVVNGWLVESLNEVHVIWLAIACNIIHLSGYASITLLREKWISFAAISLACFTFLIVPSLSALLSRASRPDEQGAALASLQAVRSMSALFGPVALVMYEEFRKPPFYMPEAPFFCGVVIACVALFLAVFQLPPLLGRWEKSNHLDADQQDGRGNQQPQSWQRPQRQTLNEQPGVWAGNPDSSDDEVAQYGRSIFTPTPTSNTAK